ncbi:MAG: DUF3108 domain-containing protein [Burkholderiaceae bacterium]
MQSIGGDPFDARDDPRGRWPRRRRSVAAARIACLLALTVLVHVAVFVMVRHSAPNWSVSTAPAPTLQVELLRAPEARPELTAAPPEAAPSDDAIASSPPSRRAPPAAASQPPRPRPHRAARPPPAVRSAARAVPPASPASPATVPAGEAGAVGANADDGARATVPATDDAIAGASPDAATATPADPSAQAPPADASSRPSPPAAAAPPAAVAPADAAPPAPRYGRALLEPARSGRLRYDLYYDDYARGASLAQVTLSFEVDGDGGYRMWTEGRAVGLTAWFYSGSLTQDSRGRVTQDGLSPLAYDEKRGSRPARHVGVDEARGVVVLPDQRTAPVEPGMQDRLSTLMQLSLFARTQPERFEPGKAVSIPEMSFGGVEPVAYRSLGYVTLPTPLGPLNAIHLRRERPGRPDEPAIEIWLGYDQAMLPIRLRVADRGGRVLDQLLKELP